MCGRFTLNVTPSKLTEYFDLTGDLDFSPSWNIAPFSQINSIVADESGSKHLKSMRWGLIPSWAKDETIGNKLINARSETIAVKPSFRSAFALDRGGHGFCAGERGRKEGFITENGEQFLASVDG